MTYTVDYLDHQNLNTVLFPCLRTFMNRRICVWFGRGGGCCCFQVLVRGFQKQEMLMGSLPWRGVHTHTHTQKLTNLSFFGHDFERN